MEQKLYVCGNKGMIRDFSISKGNNEYAYENHNIRITAKEEETLLSLTNEKNDLCHAKEMLYSLISEMDDVMQSDFLTTFKELEIEFKKVFRELL